MIQNIHFTLKNRVRYYCVNIAKCNKYSKTTIATVECLLP